jgi:hypothetical protein
MKNAWPKNFSKMLKKYQMQKMVALLEAGKIGKD